MTGPPAGGARPLVRRRLALVLAPTVLLPAAFAVWSMVRQPAPRLDVLPVTVSAATTLTVAAPSAAPVPTAPARRGTVSRAWVAKTARVTGIPAPALRADGAATRLLSSTAPGCHLGWTTLAGIGWVESQHGTIGGRRLRADGTSSRPIYGPELDGSDANAALPDPAGGWQRAGGPMQFLPSTWDRWTSDGDGDGASDRQDLDDAAYAAARYLCASGTDLTASGAWTTAVRSYNHSDAYVLAVYAAAQAYADRAG
jgi:hypothetical protein